MFALSRISARAAVASKSHGFLLNQRGASPLWKSALIRGISSSPSPVDEDQAKAGTEAWVREWVVKQGMCPFAAQSNYNIVPYCGEKIGEITSLLQTEAEALLDNMIEDNGNMPSTLLVIPNYPQFQSCSAFERVYFDMVDPGSDLNIDYSVSQHDIDETLICGPAHLLYGSKASVVAQIFHPDMNNSMVEGAGDFPGDTSALKYTLRSPWPTIQLLASSDLQNVWRDDDAISEKLLKRNATTVSNIGCQELEKQLETFRNTSALKKKDIMSLSLNPTLERWNQIHLILTDDSISSKGLLRVFKYM